MNKRLSQIYCPVDLLDQLQLHPGMKLVDVVEWLRDEKNIYVEVFLADTSTVRKTKQANEYVIRISDGSGGNISKYSTKTYAECLEDGLRSAMKICL